MEIDEIYLFGMKIMNIQTVTCEMWMPTAKFVPCEGENNICAWGKRCLNPRNFNDFSSFVSITSPVPYQDT